MNREVLFKAKRIDNREWVEGNLVLSNDVDKEYKTIIIPTEKSNMFLSPEESDLGFENWHLVDKETVCEYTGLTGKNNRKIFENDIVKTDFFGKSDDKGHNFNDYDLFKISFLDGMYVFENNRSQFPVSYIEKMTGNWLPEVIGNIFDNPELLE